METVNVSEVPEDAQIIDVRSQMEWDDGHATGAVHIPMEEIPSRYGELDLDSDIYLMCRSGGRAAQVSSWLEKNGIDTIVITGGMIDWEHFGRPMEKANSINYNCPAYLQGSFSFIYPPQSTDLLTIRRQTGTLLVGHVPLLMVPQIV